MNIFVGSLPFSIEEADLRESFEAYGAVDTVKIITDCWLEPRLQEGVFAPGAVDLDEEPTFAVTRGALQRVLPTEGRITAGHPALSHDTPSVMTHPPS